MAKNFEARDRLLAYSYNFNIIPMTSSLNELRIADLYLLDKMRNGLGTIQGIPMAGTIIWRIRELVGSSRRDITIIFPILLTRILRMHRVDFTREFRSTFGDSDILTFGTLESMGYQNRNG